MPQGIVVVVVVIVVEEVVGVGVGGEMRGATGLVEAS